MTFCEETSQPSAISLRAMLPHVCLLCWEGFTHQEQPKLRRILSTKLRYEQLNISAFGSSQK